jgi:hypothetical protein
MYTRLFPGQIRRVHLQVIVDGTSREVDGRVGEIIRWLVLHAKEINNKSKGEVAFSFSGSVVHPVKKFFGVPLKVKSG